MAVKITTQYIPNIMKYLDNVIWIKNTEGKFSMKSNDLIDVSGVKYRFNVIKNKNEKQRISWTE